jgi:hypothetical protein
MDQNSGYRVRTIVSPYVGCLKPRITFPLYRVVGIGKVLRLGSYIYSSHTLRWSRSRCQRYTRCGGSQRCHPPTIADRKSCRRHQQVSIVFPSSHTSQPSTTLLFSFSCISNNYVRTSNLETLHHLISAGGKLLTALPRVSSLGFP